MKVHKPKTDQEVEFEVIANGRLCDEFFHPSWSSESNVIECFIPVAEGDQLTLKGTFTGSCLHAAFDVLADGAFVAHKRIEGPITGDIKYYNKRKLEIKSVLDNPQEPGRTSIFASDKIVEGNLHVKRVRENQDGYGIWKGTIGAGSLAVIVSLNQATRENYTEKYASQTVGAWATGCADSVTDGGIAPDYELEHKVTDDEISKTRQTKHKRHMKQTRFGKQAWAKLIFYYRPKEAIEQAQCIPCDGASRGLEPLHDDESFVHGSTETKKALNRKGKKTQDGLAVEGDADNNETSWASRASSSSIFTTPVPEAPREEAGRHATLEAHETESHMPNGDPRHNDHPRAPRCTPPSSPPARPRSHTPRDTTTAVSIMPSLSPQPAGPGKKKKLFGQSLSSTQASPVPDSSKRSHDYNNGKYSDSLRASDSLPESTDEEIAEVFREAEEFLLTPEKAMKYQAPTALMIGSTVAADDESSAASSVVVDEIASTSVPVIRVKQEQQEEGFHDNDDAKTEAETHYHDFHDTAFALEQTKGTPEVTDKDLQENKSSIMLLQRNMSPPQIMAPQHVASPRQNTKSPQQIMPSQQVDSPQRSSTPSLNNITVDGRTITAEDVGWHIQTSGSTLWELADAVGIEDEFTHNKDLTRKFVQLVQAVGYRMKDDPNTFYLKGSQWRASQASQEGIFKRFRSPAASQGEGSPKAEQIKDEKLVKESTPIPVKTQSSARSSVAPATSIGTKRPASAMTPTTNRSRESTPLAKRQRREEQAARKAAAIKLRDETRARKVAAEAARDAKVKEREKELALRAEREAAEAERDRMEEEEIARILAEGGELADEAEEVEREGEALGTEVRELVEERREDEELEGRGLD